MFERVEQSAKNALDKTEHFAEVLSQSAMHAIVQEPIDGLTQLANHVVKPLTGYTLPHLELVDAAPAAKLGSADWWAEAIGTGLGRGVDCVLLSHGLGAVGLSAVESASARAAVTGGVYGFAVQPSREDEPFWKQRIVKGAGWAAGTIVSSALGNKTSEALSDIPSLSSSAAVQTIVRGSTSGIAKTGLYQAFHLEEAGTEPASRRIVQGIARSIITQAMP